MNLPNKISIARICLIPFFILFYMLGAFQLMPYGCLVAFLVFVLASCTDFIDGMIARKRNLVTDLGKFLDPIADKCLLLAGLLLIISCPLASGNPVMFSDVNYYFVGVVGIVGAIIMLARELIISAFRQIAATKNVVMMADKSGKIKAVVQDVAVAGYFLLATLMVDFGIVSGTVFTVLSLTLFVLYSISIILTIVSGVNYIVKNKQVLNEVKK